MDRYQPRSLADLENAAFRARYPKQGNYSALHGLLDQKPGKKEDSFPFGVGVAAFLATGATIGLGAPDTHASSPIMEMVKQFQINPTADSYSLEDVGFPETEQPLDTSEIIEAQEEPVVTRLPEIAQIAPEKIQSTVEAPNSNNLASIFKVMEQYPNTFGKVDFEGLQMYRPIYKAAGEKFGVDPMILMIFHGQETTYSLDPRTGIKRAVRDYDDRGVVVLQNTVYGAGQRDVRFYDDRFVKEAFQGLEYLASIKTNQPDDAQEIAAIAAILKRHIAATQGDLLAAFKKYSHPQFAIERWQLYNLYSKILPKF